MDEYMFSSIMEECDQSRASEFNGFETPGVRDELYNGSLTQSIEDLSIKIITSSGDNVDISNVKRDISYGELKKLLHGILGETYIWNMSLMFPNGLLIQPDSYQFERSEINPKNNAINLILQKPNIRQSQLWNACFPKADLTSAFDYICISVHFQMIIYNFYPIRRNKSKNISLVGDYMMFYDWDKYETEHREFFYQDGSRLSIKNEDETTAVIQINNRRKFYIAINGFDFINFDHFLSLNPLQLNIRKLMGK